MKLKLLLVIFFLPMLLNAQSIKFSPLTFNKNYWECENKWVVLKDLNPNDTTFLGFIYLDEEAGYTEELSSNIKLMPSGDLVLIPFDTLSIKYTMKIRLSDGDSPFIVLKDANTGEKIKTVRMDGEKNKYAILPDDIVKHLGLPIEPEWLKYYKRDTTTANYFTRLGFHLNHVGRSDSALVFLEKSYKMNEKDESTCFELSYAYNALGHYESAIKVIDKAIIDYPKNEYINKELGYAFLSLSKYSEAEKAYLNLIKISDNNSTKCEAILNLIKIFASQNRIVELNYWIPKGKEFAKDIPEFMKMFEYLEAQLKNQR